MSSFNKLHLLPATLLLLLLPLFLSPLPAATADFVLDASGKPLRNGGAYVVTTNDGGYIGFRPKDPASPCSGAYVARQTFDKRSPPSIRFTQPTKQAFLLASTNLFASFGPNRACHQTGAWQLTGGSTPGLLGTLVVDTNGTLGQENTKFKIEKVATSGTYNYKFTLCPNTSFLLYCGNIALKDQGVLGLNGSPPLVQFLPDTKS